MQTSITDRGVKVLRILQYTDIGEVFCKAGKMLERCRNVDHFNDKNWLA